MTKQKKFKICPECGKMFFPATGAQKFCSENCQRTHAGRKGYWSDYGQYRAPDNAAKNELCRKIYAVYAHKCAICGWQGTEELVETDRGIQWAYGNEIHHITSVKNGGKATWENSILLCPNHHKQAHMGVLSEEDLKKYQKSKADWEQLQATIRKNNRSEERITAAIFGEFWEEVRNDDIDS